MKILNSTIDETINHVYPDGSEFRFVMRSDHPTIYLSSHTGCNLRCQMCYLTTTGQQKQTDLSTEQILNRALAVSDAGRRIHLPRDHPRMTVNLSFMSRGDALANRLIRDGTMRTLMEEFGRMYGHARINISTIFPRRYVDPDLGPWLLDRFGPFQPSFYWSLYSINPEFRAKWLPEASDPDVVAAGLKAWQDRTLQDVVIHHALIAGENDAWDDAYNIRLLMARHKLRYRVNLVRYNPPNDSSKEASDGGYKAYAAAFHVPVKIQPRVGYDVMASCGMFVGKEAV